jgi:hypothetical protein
MRESISASQRLSLTPRYLATGNTFKDLKFILLIYFYWQYVNKNQILLIFSILLINSSIPPIHDQYYWQYKILINIIDRVWAALDSARLQGTEYSN